MAEGAQNVMRITIHPLLLVMLLTVALTNDIATYCLLLISLVFHELGHLLAAKWVNVRVSSCILMPYGGEITFINNYAITAKQWLIIALGGPIASVIGIVIASFLPELLAHPLTYYQSILLLINCLPFWPLDGGRIICYGLLTLMPNSKIYNYILICSLYFFILVFLVACFLWQQVVVALLSIFLFLQVYKEWRLRKYRAAYQKIVLNRLT